MWTTANTARFPMPRVTPVMWAIAIWGVICVACLARAYCNPTRQTVFHDYGHAGQAWLEGTDAYQLDHGGERFIPTMSGFRYAPIVAVLLAPFSLFGQAVGGVLWRLASVVCFIMAFAWYVREALPEWGSYSDSQRAWLWLLLLPLSLASINNGQANVLLMGLLLGAGVAVVQERWNLAAGLLAAACLLKLYPMAVAFLFLLIEPRRLIWRFLMALAIGLAIPFALQSPGYVTHAYENWLVLVGSDNRRDFPLAEGYRDFYLLTRVVGAPLGPIAYLCVRLAAGAVAAGIVLLGRSRAWSAPVLVTTALGLGCSWMAVFGPSVESCTYIQIAPALAFALVAVGHSSDSRWSKFVLMLTYALFLAAFISAWFRESRNWMYLAQPIAALIFLVERCWHGAWQRDGVPAATQDVTLARE